MRNAMANLSMPFMRIVLKYYQGFKGVRTLVDVGGISGFSLHMIIQMHGHIKVINCVLPHVVAGSPTYDGIACISILCFGSCFPWISFGFFNYVFWVLCFFYFKLLML